MVDTSYSMEPNSDFVRLGLHATRNGEIQTESLLIEWFQLLETLLADIGSVPPREQSQILQLLILTGRFQRTFFGETNPTARQRFAQAAQIVDQLQQEHYEAAVRSIVSRNYLEKAERLQQDLSDDSIEDHEAIQAATTILEDWDDVGIVIALAEERFDLSPAPGVRRARLEFLNWLCTEGDTILLLASDRIQTMAAAFDPNLAANHLELDISTHDYAVLLDALEDIEKAMDCHPDWVAAKIVELQALLQPAFPPQTPRSAGPVDIPGYNREDCLIWLERRRADRQNVFGRVRGDDTTEAPTVDTKFDDFLEEFMRNRPDEEDELTTLAQAAEAYPGDDKEFRKYLVDVHYDRGNFWRKMNNHGLVKKHWQAAIDIAQKLHDDEIQEKFETIVDNLEQYREHYPE